MNIKDFTVSRISDSASNSEAKVAPSNNKTDQAGRVVRDNTSAGEIDSRILNLIDKADLRSRLLIEEKIAMTLPLRHHQELDSLFEEEACWSDFNNGENLSGKLISRFGPAARMAGIIFNDSNWDFPSYPLVTRMPAEQFVDAPRDQELHLTKVLHFGDITLQQYIEIHAPAGCSRKIILAPHIPVGFLGVHRGDWAFGDPWPEMITTARADELVDIYLSARGIQNFRRDEVVMATRTTHMKV